MTDRYEQIAARTARLRELIDQKHREDLRALTEPIMDRLDRLVEHGGRPDDWLDILPDLEYALALLEGGAIE